MLVGLLILCIMSSLSKIIEVNPFMLETLRFVIGEFSIKGAL
jgi:hypothetical protein